MITAAETAELLQTAFRFSFSAPRDFPVVVDGNAMTLCPAAIESRAVIRNVIFGATMNQLEELGFREVSHPMALASGTHLDPIHHGLIELQTLFGSSRARGHV